MGVQLRVRIVEYWSSFGYTASVEIRREHVDPPFHWDRVFTTEPYSTQNAAKRRATQWVREHHPSSVS
jgi:hypothetical protein